MDADDRPADRRGRWPGLSTSGDQGYRSCLGLLRLTCRDSMLCLEAACALTIGARSDRHVDSILKHGLDRLPASEHAGR